MNIIQCHIYENGSFPIFRWIEKHAAKLETHKVNLTLKRAEILKKRNLEKAMIVETLKSLLQCNDLESSEIYYNHVNEINELYAAKEAVAYLLKNGISLRVIKENAFLLAMQISMTWKFLSKNYPIYSMKLIFRCN